MALAVTLAGCGASATQNWRTGPDLSAPMWSIKGTQGAWGSIKVTINDQPAMTGRVSVFTGGGTLEGSFDGKPLTGECKRGKSSSVRTQCVISSEGRKVTTLYFRVK